MRASRRTFAVLLGIVPLLSFGVVEIGLETSALAASAPATVNELVSPSGAASAASCPAGIKPTVGSYTNLPSAIAAAAAGKGVVLVDGKLVWFLERGGRSLLSFADDDSDANHAAAVAVADLVAAGRVNSILVERINSAPVLGPQVSASVVTALSDAGFARTPRGLRLR